MNIILGQFIPTGSIIEYLDARIKLICTFLYIASVFMCDSVLCFGLCALFLCVVIAISKLSFFRILKGIKGMAFILLFTVVMNLLFYHEGESILKFGIINITDESVINSLVIASRLILVVLFPSILTLTTKPLELTIAIEDLLSPLKRFKVPVTDLAMMMSIALRFIPTLYDEMDKIKKAQISRGADFDTGSIFKRIKSLAPVIVPLFVSSFRRADELAYAMEARCYDGSVARTRLNNPKLYTRDYISITIMVIFVIGIIIMEHII